MVRVRAIGVWTSLRRVRAHRGGYFPEPETGEYVKVAEPEKDEDEDEDGQDDDPWQVDVVLRRRGELRLPVDVVLTFENGETESFVWTREQQAEATWLRRVVSSSSKLSSARLDPSSKIWLDKDMSNNQWYAEKDPVAAWRWSERALSQMARYLQWFSRFGG